MVLGPLMIDIAGIVLTDADRDLLQHPLVGGVILFSRNYQSIPQLQALIQAIHELPRPAPSSPLLIAVDHEGGRVQRFREGFTRLPAVAQLGMRYDEDAAAALKLAETTGWLMAAELRAVGVDFSFAPVLDLGRGVSSVIGDRAFHRQVDAVSSLAQAYIRGMRQAGMAAVGKHFPGHGAVVEDSHHALPVDHRPYPAIEIEDIVPFERMIRYGGIAGIMPAHVIYDQVDTLPAGFSSVWLQQILRERLHFQGVIFSDDISMAAASAGGSHTHRAQLALQAGCDMVLICNNRAAAQVVIDQLTVKPHPASQLRLVRMHGGPALDNEELRQAAQWRQAVIAVTGYAPVEPELNMDTP